ncbi:MAG: hypothetical protein NC115_07840 [Bacteroidales bacterium]|nr:hypothetical protein [Bacteroides sp.]MCM1502558.1 hypothetical protein [Bacteroidales bacterium]
MKKKILVCCMWLIAICSAEAVDWKSGSFHGLKIQDEVKVEFDFSSVIIDGMTLDEFRQGARIDEDFSEWGGFESFLIRRFMSGLNGETLKLRENRVYRTGDFKSGYKLVVKPLQMNLSGEYSIDFILVNLAVGEVEGIANEIGDGGTFGSFSNLMGDGFEECAEAFAKFIKKSVK